MCDLNAQMNDTPKMDKFTKKLIFLNVIAKVGGRCFVQVPKVS